MIDTSEKGEQKRRNRWGWIVAVGGVVFAVASLWTGPHSHVPALIGFGAALIGAGMIEPVLVIQAWREWRGWGP